MLGLVEIMLIVTILVPGKAPMHHSEPMPDLVTCLKEAEEFLNHEFPDALGAIEVGATCKGGLPKSHKS